MSTFQKTSIGIGKVTEDNRDKLAWSRVWQSETRWKSLLHDFRLRMNSLEVFSYLSGIRHCQFREFLLPDDIWFGNVDEHNRYILAPWLIWNRIGRRSPGINFVSIVVVSLTKNAINLEATNWSQSSKHADNSIVACNNMRVISTIDNPFGDFSLGLSKQTIVCGSNSVWSLQGFEILENRSKNDPTFHALALQMFVSIEACLDCPR